jgi:acetyl esterase/lipase
VSHALLIESIVALALTVNAIRPVPWPPFQIPSFFASWLCMELAPHNLVIQVGLTVGFVAAGALDQTLGWIGLGLSLLAMAGLAWLIVVGHRAKHVVEEALSETLGADYLSRIRHPRKTDYDLRVPWRQLLLPFHMKHPDVERIRNIRFSDDHKRLRLDVYRHRDRPTRCPTLLQIHGGGWAISNKDQQGKPIILHFASRGWVCFAPNYRLSPRATWPAHIVDIKRAIAWIREHGHEYGADPGFIVVTGGSAGGHLAALAGTTPNDPAFQPGFEDADTSVQAAAPYYGVYDFTQWSWLERRFIERRVMKKRLLEARPEFEAASPLYRVSEDDPPFFVIHGHRDSLVPVEEAREFVTRLREVSNAPVVYAELPGAQHAFDVFPSIRTAHVIRAVERFVDFVYSTRYAEEHTKREAEAEPTAARPAAL